MEKIIWGKPKKKKKPKKKLSHNKFLLENIDFVIDADRELFEQKYSNTLVPSIPTVSPKEELLILLKLAAEVEHTLLIQYLYAAYTISDNSPLKKAIIFIAVQEMGHLLAVQNLLLSIGGMGNLHLAKNEHRLNSGEKLLPYTLEPFSKLVLSKFVAVEAPVQIPDEYKKEVDEIHNIAKGKAGIEFNPVGGLYMKIFWLFQKDDTPDELMKIYPNEQFIANRHIVETDFLPISEIKKYEARYNTWDLSGGGSVGIHNLTLSSVYGSDDARKLVARIADQGEGADMSKIDSHFEKFLIAYRQFDQNPPNTIEAPLNPISQENIEFPNPSKIENEYTLLWNKLMNKIYSSLLLDIFSCMFYYELTDTDKDRYIRLVFTNMNSLLKTLSQIIFKLPLDNGEFHFNTTPLAAPTFEIDSAFKICKDKMELDTLNNNFLDQIEETTKLIKTNPTFINIHSPLDTDASSVFYNIKDYYDEKKELVNQAILYTTKNKQNG